MLYGVLDELSHGHRQRRRNLSVDFAEITVDRDLDALISDDRVLGHRHQRGQDVVEGHLVARLSGEHFVDEGDRSHPTLGFEER